MWYKKAKKEYHSGVMIAFYIPRKIAKQLHKLTKEYVKKTEPVSEFHMTLAYLGDKSDINEHKNAVLEAMKKIAKDCNTYIKGNVSGMGVFAAGDDGTRPLYASLDCPDLPAFRQKIVESLNSIKGLSVISNHGFTPHCTLAYLPNDDEIPPINIPIIDLEFDTLAISWGEEEIKYKLGE